MLTLETLYREALLRNGSLTTNEAGEEVLRGLSHMQSLFVLDFEAGGLAEAEVGEVMIYNQLIIRHNTAKILYKASQVQSKRQHEVSN